MTERSTSIPSRFFFYKLNLHYKVTWKRSIQSLTQLMHYVILYLFSLFLYHLGGNIWYDHPTCSLKIFVPITILAFAVLVPVNWTGGTLERFKDLTFSDIDKLSISNIPPGSQRYAKICYQFSSLLIDILKLVCLPFFKVRELLFIYLVECLCHNIWSTGKENVWLSNKKIFIR